MNGVKSVASASGVSPTSTVSVATTDSLAANPVTRAVEARQSPNPSGAKMGEMADPMMASRLCDWSATMLRRTSKVCRNQMATLARKIIVNALVRKSLALSQARRSVVPALGMR